MFLLTKQECDNDISQQQQQQQEEQEQEQEQEVQVQVQVAIFYYTPSQPYFCFMLKQ